ncbi:MAG: leucine-rich repeat protein, partial [Bacillota bacterium]
SYAGSTPTKTATAEYTYTFSDWDKTIVSVTGTATYTATFTDSTNSYTIKFIDGDGTTVQESAVAYGVTPNYTGSTPTKTATAEYTYTFSDWDKTIVSVTGTATYTATFTDTAVTFAITYVLNGGTNSNSNLETYTASDTISLANATTTETDDIFGGWYTDSDCTEYFKATSISDDITLYALWVMDLSYTNNTTYYSVAQNSDITTTDIVIPSVYFGLPVTTIADDGFKSNTDITSVTIPESVTTIGTYAFYGCTGLTSVSISEYVTSLGESSFQYCTSLETVDYNYNAETTATYASSTAPFSYSGSSANGCKLIIGDKVTTIAEYTFYNFDYITSVTIPTSVEKIGDKAFSSCAKLATVYYGGTTSDWSQIEFDSSSANPMYYASAFYADGATVTPVAEIEITGETEIEAYAFYGFSNITSVAIGDSVTTIGTYAFYKCSGLESVTIGSDVTAIGSYAFGICTAVANVYYGGIESDWSQISFSDYYANPANSDSTTTNLYLNGEKSSAVTEIEITGETEIKAYAFYGFEGIESVTIGSGVTTIGKYAFSDCTGLTSVTIPTSVTTINASAFTDCTAVANVYYGGTESKWSQISFSGGYPSNPANSDSTTTNLYLNGETSIAVTAIDITGVTEIASCAFYGFEGLTSVTIGDGVETIGSYAFYGCTGLTSVTIGDSVETIGSYAFYGCTGLTSVEIPDSVETISIYAFKGCTGLTSVTIGSSVTKIGNYAFSGCTGLTSVTFKDTSTWYWTTSSQYSNGILISDLTDTTENATYLKTKFYSKYWYKS